MDPDPYRIEYNHVEPCKGCVLIAEPFLRDHFFGRSVVYVVEHEVGGGTMGLVLNKPLPVMLGDIMSDCYSPEEIPVYRGGPLAMDTLFYLHNLPDVPGSLPVDDGIYLNGDFESVRRYIVQGNPVRSHLRFFLGYAGWEDGQLAEECEADTWLVRRNGRPCLGDDTDRQWENAMSSLGDKYRVWATFTQMPELN